METIQLITLIAAATGIYFLYKIVMIIRRMIFKIGIITAILAQAYTTTDFENIDKNNLLPSIMENNSMVTKAADTFYDIVPDLLP